MTSTTTHSSVGVVAGLLSIWKVVAVGVAGGALWAFCPSMIAVYDTMTTEILDCSRYNSGSGTCPVDTGYCVLVGTACIFPHRDLCSTSSMTGKPLTYSECVAVDAGLGGLVADASTTPYRYYSSCQWVSNKCEATNEIPSSRLGILASAPTIGGLAGATVGSVLLHRFGFRNVLLGIGVSTLIVSVITHLFPFVYPTMILMRFLYGLATGVACVASPTYVEVYTPQSLRDVAGCMFQIAVTLSIAFTAVVGYLLSRTDGVLTSISLQSFLFISTALSAAMIAVALYCVQGPAPEVPQVTNYDEGGVAGPSHQELAVVGAAHQTVGGSLTKMPPFGFSPLGASPPGTSTGGLVNVLGSTPLTQTITIGGLSPPNNNPFHRVVFASTPPVGIFGISPPPADTMGHVTIGTSGGGGGETATGGALDAPVPSETLPTFWSFNVPEIKRAFTCVTVLLLVMQFTGINAVMNYAPRIAKSMGVPPMLGNAVIMVWNFVTTLAAVPLASIISVRKLYLAGLLIASVGCGISSVGSYLTGSAGGAPSALASFISCVGIATFIASFEAGMAPTGFVLVGRAYPSHLTGEAMGYYNAGQFLGSFFIVMSFPVISDALSDLFYTSLQSSTMVVAASTTDDTTLEASTAYASSVLFGGFTAVGIAGWFVLKPLLPN